MYPRVQYNRMSERLRVVELNLVGKKERKRKKIRNFEQLVKVVLATEHNTPERHALNDWFALVEVNTRRIELLSEVEARRYFGLPEEVFLASELNDVEEWLSHRMRVYRHNAYYFYKQYPNRRKDPYNNTLSSLDLFYKERMKAERANILSQMSPSYYIQGQIEA